MTKHLYRTVVLTTAIAWLEVGMRLSRTLAIQDGGRSPEPSDWIVLASLIVWGTLGVVVLWPGVAPGNPSASDAAGD